MVKNITAKIIPKTYIVFDTSILFHENKMLVVTDDLKTLVDDFSGKCEIQYCLPEVVKKELIYQQRKYALSRLTVGHRELKIINEMFGKSKKALYSEKEIKSRTLKRFEKWEKANKIEILETPVDIIDWKQLIDDSVNRVPPFEDSENREEKGFRDALIMHTVLKLANILKDDGTLIAFICNDRLLREATRDRFKPIKRLAVFESIDEFTSYQKLRLEELSEDFIKKITERASIKFMNKKDSSGLFYKEQLHKKIKEDFAEIFNPLSSDRLTTYEEIDRGSFWIRLRPTFIETKEKNIFVWESLVTHRQTYRERIHDTEREVFTHKVAQIKARESKMRRRRLPSTEQDEFLEKIKPSVFGSVKGDERDSSDYATIDRKTDKYDSIQIRERDKVYERRFQVIWSSKVAKNGRFSDIKLLEINYRSAGFRKYRIE